MTNFIMKHKDLIFKDKDWIFKDINWIWGKKNLIFRMINLIFLGMAFYSFKIEIGFFDEKKIDFLMI